jgi:hypothetical protein
MPFPPNQDHRIPLAAAQAMTKRYRDGIAKGDETAQMFPREVFEQLLKNPKVRGIRFYYARNDGGRMQMVAVGVDGDGNDMLADGDIFDRGFPCPPFCTGGIGLNS